MGNNVNDQVGNNGNVDKGVSPRREAAVERPAKATHGVQFLTIDSVMCGHSR